MATGTMSTILPETEAYHELRMTVRGRVQGVGFRAWVRGEAERIGITGSVRNRDDGSVEVLARGTSAALDRFHQLLSQGPAGSDVAGVTRDPATDIPTEGFLIAD